MRRAGGDGEVLSATLAYVAGIVAINMAFSLAPDLNWLWSIAVGGIFVARDYSQRSLGHWVLLPTLIGVGLSYWLASPFVAAASAAAFAASELADWAVYTLTKRPLADRILLSSAISTPIDSAVFLGIIGFLTPWAFAAQVGSKMIAAVIVWATLRAAR